MGAKVFYGFGLARAGGVFRSRLFFCKDECLVFSFIRLATFERPGAPGVALPIRALSPG